MACLMHMQYKCVLFCGLAQATKHQILSHYYYGVYVAKIKKDCTCTMYVIHFLNRVRLHTFSPQSSAVAVWRADSSLLGDEHRCVEMGTGTRSASSDK